jgi:hypothetical protein
LTSRNQQEDPAPRPGPEPVEKASDGRIPSITYRYPRRSVLKRIRVRKQDSAFVYAILESHEGIAAYSTLAHKPEDLYRDLELQIPPDFVAEAERLLRELGELVYDLEPG